MKEKIFTTFAKYVSLNVMGMVGLSCYILGDTFFVASGLGANGLTALNLAIPIYSFIHGLGLMVGMGGATKYSIIKSDGGGEGNKIFTRSVMLALIISLCLLLIGAFFSRPLSTLLGANAVVHEMTSTYLGIILVFAPMFMLNNVVICFVRNDGNPKLSMIAMLIGSLSNIILDYIFIFPLSMGMFGAALATGIAPIISLAILSSHFIRRKNKFTLKKTLLKFAAVKDIVSLGVSSLIVEVSSGIVMITFNTIILVLLGNLGVAAYSIIANLSLVVVAIFTGISQGIQPIISSNYGSKNMGVVKKTRKYAVVTAILFAIIIYIIGFIFARPLVGIFNKDGNAELTLIAINGIRIYFMAFIFVGINAIIVGYLSAIAKARQAFVISILRGFIVILPMAFILSSLMGINGVWLAFPLTELIVMTLAIRTVRAH